MTVFAGMDVGDKASHICVVDDEGAIVWRGVCATDPEAIAGTLRRHAPDLSRVVLETGSLSTFIHHGLAERAIPVVASARAMRRRSCRRAATRAIRTMPRAWRSSRAPAGSRLST